ncbi:MAG: hypothetical protein E7032_06060 [Akkermansiaceae bacterium]|nr:hypothetical protein [Akkermansiaceae bacterium]
MNAVSPCALPRRRFVLWFLGGCVLWVVACGVYRGMLSRELLPTPEFVTLFLLEVVMLSIPSRTSHGTLMQLIGLAMPLSAAVLLTLVVVEWWFPSPEKVPWTELIMIPFGLVTMAGLFLYPLGFGLICRMHSQSTTK